MEGSSENSSREQPDDLDATPRTSSPIPESVSGKSSEKSFKTLDSDESERLYYSQGALLEMDRLKNRNEYLEQENKILRLQNEQKNLTKKFSIGTGKLEADLEVANKQKVELEEKNARLNLALTQSQTDKQSQDFVQVSLEAENADLRNQLAECETACEKYQCSETNLSQLLAQAESAKQKTATALSAQKETNEKLQIKLESTENELSAAKDHSRVQLELKNEELAACEAKIFDLDIKNSTLHASLDDLREKHQKITTRMKQQNAEISMLETKQRTNQPVDLELQIIRQEIAMKRVEVGHNRKIKRISDYLNDFESKIRSKSAGMKISRV